MVILELKLISLQGQIVVTKKLVKELEEKTNLKQTSSSGLMLSG